MSPGRLERASEAFGRKKVQKKSRKDLRKLRDLISSKSATEKAAAEKRV
jgi:hypothetical protein